MDLAERRATAALWSIQGVGPVTIREVRQRLGPLGDLLERPVASWAPLIPWRGEALARVLSLGSLAAGAERLERRCQALGARILHHCDPGFPPRLKVIGNAPLLLFAFGPGAETSARRRLAIVGTRSLEAGALNRLMEVAASAARSGLGIVSGAAIGCDQAAHRGALSAQGETWAFLGSALDEIDAPQQAVTREILDGGGTLFSEFPPGCRPNLSSFVLRNRLISGASDAVLVFRAPLKSGALHTAEAAVEQGRPLLATPGDPWNVAAQGSNRLLREGLARAHLELEDLLSAVGLKGTISSPEPAKVDLSSLSPLALEVLEQLSKGSSDFEGLLGAMPGPTSGQLSGALVELEVAGLVLHKGGRRYEKL